MEISGPKEISSGYVQCTPHQELHSPGEPQGEITSPAALEETDLPALNEAAERSEASQSTPKLTNAWQIVELPQLTGVETVSPEYLEMLTRQIEQYPYIGTALLSGEVNWTEKEQSVLGDAGDAVIDLAAYADVEAPLHRHSFHMMPDRPSYTAAWRLNYPNHEDRSTESSAFTDIDKGVVIDRTHNDAGDPASMWRNLVHESIHAASKKFIVPASDGFIPIWAWSEEPSFERTDDANPINLWEVVAEMGTYRTIRHTDNMPDVPQLPAYAVHVIAAEGLMLDAAAFHGMEPEEVEKALYRYNFGGDKTAIQILEEGIAPKRMTAFFGMPLRCSDVDVARAVLDNLFSRHSHGQLELLTFERPLRPLFEWQED